MKCVRSTHLGMCKWTDEPLNDYEATILSHERRFVQVGNYFETEYLFAGNLETCKELCGSVLGNHLGVGPSIFSACAGI